MSFDDETIRSRLQPDAESIGSTTPASVVFGQLKPRLRRARRRRRIAIGTTGVVFVGAAAAALQFGLDARPTSVRTYGENEGGISEQTAGPARTDGANRTGSTTPHGSVTTSSTTEPTTSTSASVPTSSGIGVPAAPIPGPPPAAGTEAPTPVDPTTTTTSVVADTLPPAPPIDTHQIDSACGSIVVENVDDRVDLVDVMANAGFEVDVKSRGPENVEVGLHGGDDECELKARVVGGQLVTTVEGPGGRDESDDGSQSREPGDDDD